MADYKLPDWIPSELRTSPLCLQALTHRSARGGNYERLEFLGDALLGMIIAESLFESLPSASEGELTRLRAALVKRETLAEIARERSLGELLRLGQGELKSGGFRRDSILADVIESLIGAYYLVSGFAAVCDFVRQLYGSRLQDLPNAESLKDPKTRLQERLQASGIPLPVYEVIEVSGEAHQQRFRVRCVLSGKPEPSIMEAVGSSRRKAEQASAKAMLALLDKEQDISYGR